MGWERAIHRHLVHANLRKPLVPKQPLLRAHLAIDGVGGYRRAVEEEEREGVTGRDRGVQ